MKYHINVGDVLPQFEARDQEGHLLNSESFRGTPLVLYFYPKNDTPGCTKEACSFRDNLNRLKSRGAALVGVSPDSADSHKNFVSKFELNFPLLVDETKAICLKFDTIQEKINYGKKSKGVERTTFVIDTQGIIRWIERPVAVEGHVERVLEAINSLSL